MQFSNTVNHGLAQTLDRLCGTTLNTYSYKAKAADVNDALHWYFGIAFSNGLNWEFDDINQTSPPIDTQSIVSGTNRYKLSAFTEKIVNLIKLDILDSTGKGINLMPETFDTLGSPAVGSESGVISGVSGQTFQELYLNAPSGTPTNYTKFGDFIYLRPNPNYSLSSALKAYFNRPASQFLFVPVVANTDDTLTATAHGLSAGDTVIFETDGTIPTGLTADTQYYVISSGLTADVFKVSATLGGSAIDITNAQTSSNHAFLKTSKEPGINLMHHPMLARKAAITFMTFNNTNGVYNARLSAVLPEHQKDERKVGEYFSNRDKEVHKKLSAAFQNNQ